MAWGKDDLPAFHAGVEGITGAKSELSPDGTGENHLSLAGNAGLHGKNILPREGLGAQDGCETAALKRGAGVAPRGHGRGRSIRDLRNAPW